MPPVRARHIALLVLLGMVWGVSFMAIKAGLSHFDPIWFAALRYDLAALAMLAVALPMGWRALIPRSRAQWGALVATGALNVMGYHALLFWGQQFTASVIAAVIIGLNPIANTVISRMVLPGERVGAGGILGLGAGLLGLAVLVGLKPGELLDARGIGELAIALAIICWAGGAVTAKRLAHQMPVIPFTAVQMTIGAILLHVVSFAVEGSRPRTEWNMQSITGLLYLSVVASAFGFLIYFSLLEKIGPIRTSLVSYIAPGFAAIAGWIVLHETLETRAVVAYLLILTGFTLVMRSRPRPRPAAPTGPAGSASAKAKPGPQP